MEVDNGYVARPGAAPTHAEEVDRLGVKIAVAQGSAPHTVLQRLITNAEILPIPGGFEPAREALATGKADVYGENLHLAHRIADALPGARVLPPDASTLCRWRSEFVIEPPRRFPRWMNS